LFGNAAPTGDRSHPKLNTRRRPIAKKYSDGKVKRTLKKRLKVLEIVKRESSVTSICRRTVLRVDVPSPRLQGGVSPLRLGITEVPLAHSVLRLVDVGSVVGKRLGRRLVGSRPFRYSSLSILTSGPSAETCLRVGDPVDPWSLPLALRVVREATASWRGRSSWSLRRRNGCGRPVL